MNVYACSSVLLPQWSSCIYNSAMLLAFRMPFFPISPPYNSVEATIVPHQSRHDLQSLHIMEHSLVLCWDSLVLSLSVHCNYC